MLLVLIEMNLLAALPVCLPLVKWAYVWFGSISVPVLVWFDGLIDGLDIIQSGISAAFVWLGNRHSWFCCHIFFGLVGGG